MEDLTLVYTVPGDLRESIQKHIAGAMGPQERQADGSIVQRPLWASEEEFIKQQLDGVLHRITLTYPTDEMKELQEQQAAAERALVSVVTGRTKLHPVPASQVQSLLKTR